MWDWWPCNENISNGDPSVLDGSRPPCPSVPRWIPLLLFHYLWESKHHSTQVLLPMECNEWEKLLRKLDIFSSMFWKIFFQEILPFSCYLWIFIIFLPTQVLGNINLIFLSKYCSILIWVSPYFASTVQNFKWAKWIFLISLYFSWGKNVWYLPRQGVASHTLFMFQHCSDF